VLDEICCASNTYGGEIRNTYKILTGKPEGRRPFGRATMLLFLKTSVQFSETKQLRGMTGKSRFSLRLSVVSVAAEGEGRRTLLTCQYIFPFSSRR
jgi:hypothetical protein